MYGGTKQEMERLLKDAEKLTGKKYDVSNYADIVEAIHAIQTQMDITGTTAKEAEKTIEGSAKATAAAWKNVLTALGSGKNVKSAMRTFTKNAKNLIKNVVPVIKRAMQGVGELITELAPTISRELPNLIRDLAPSVLKAAGSMFIELAKALPGLMKSLIPALSQFRFSLFQAIDEIIPGFQHVASSINNTVVLFVREKLIPALKEIWKYISGTLYPLIRDAWVYKIKPVFVDTFNAIKRTWQYTLKPALNAIWVFVEKTLAPNLENAWETIKTTISTVFDAVKKAWETTLRPAFRAIRSWVENSLIPVLSTVWTETISPAISAAFDVIKTVWETVLRPVFRAVKNWVGQNIQPVFEALSTFWTETLGPALSDLGDAFLYYLRNIVIPLYSFIGNHLSRAFKSLAEWWTDELQPKLKELGDAFNTFKTRVLLPIGTFVKTVFLDSFKKVSAFFGGTMDESINGENGFIAALQLIKTLGEPVVEWLGTAFDTAVENFKTAINGLITFLTLVFKGDWEGAWTALVNSFGTIFRRLKALVTTPVNAVIDLLNGMIRSVRDAVNTVINGINSALKVTIPAVRVKWEWGIPHFSLDFANPAAQWSSNIPTISWGDEVIPKLAKGGILSNGDAIWAEAGPEALSVRNGKAYVQPLTNNSRISGIGGNDEILALLRQYLPTIARMKVVLDSGALVGEVNRGLGTQAVSAMRYNAT